MLRVPNENSGSGHQKSGELLEEQVEETEEDGEYGSAGEYDQRQANGILARGPGNFAQLISGILEIAEHFVFALRAFPRCFHFFRRAAFGLVAS
jgi:hypothetical protein